MPLNKPSPRLSILRAQLAAEAMDRLCKRITYAGSARNPRVSRAAPPNADLLPMPPSYWDDLEHWLKTLAPAKPAATGDAYVSAKQPEPAAEVWHSEAPPVAGVYAMDYVSNETRNATIWCAWFDGAGWHGIVRGQDAWAVAQARRESAEPTIAVEWLRLIEADKPAQQPAQKASTHSVCIRAYGPWKVGEVACWDGVPQAIPANWLPCDASGWVTHVPTADSVCPVPDGVLYEYRLRRGNGHVGKVNPACWKLGTEGNRKPDPLDVIAWRPIAQS